MQIFPHRLQFLASLHGTPRNKAGKLPAKNLRWNNYDECEVFLFFCWLLAICLMEKDAKDDKWRQAACEFAETIRFTTKPWWLKWDWQKCQSDKDFHLNLPEKVFPLASDADATFFESYAIITVIYWGNHVRQFSGSLNFTAIHSGARNWLESQCLPAARPN